MALVKILEPMTEMIIMAVQFADVGDTIFDKTPSTQLDCQVKGYCTQMKTCAEARMYLTQCNIQSLDRDKDGVLCEALFN